MTAADPTRHPFDPSQPWFVTDTKPRCDRLAELSRAGWAVPRNGPWSTLKRLDRALVLYTDERAHCGEGKELWPPGDPPPENPHVWCSEWVGESDRAKPDRTHSKTTRYLYVGTVQVEIRYESDRSWMSNVGGTFRVMPYQSNRDKRDLLRYPLYAVDAVERADYPYGYALDLNVCPGVPLEVFNLVGLGNLQAAYASFVEENK